MADSCNCFRLLAFSLCCYAVNSGGKEAYTMRLFHVSEESNIEIFVPRIPYRKDVDQSKGLVWSLTESQLPN